MHTEGLLYSSWGRVRAWCICPVVERERERKRKGEKRGREEPDMPQPPFKSVHSYSGRKILSSVLFHMRRVLPVLPIPYFNFVFWTQGPQLSDPKPGKN